MLRQLLAQADRGLQIVSALQFPLEIGELKLSQIGSLLGTAFTLAVLLSIDTLKTAVVLDAGSAVGLYRRGADLYPDAADL